MAPEMEIQGGPRRTPTPSTPEFMLKGKQLMGVERNHEWDLNDWQWNGNLFIAKPSNSAILIDDCRIVHPSGLNGPSNEVGSGTAASEKRRKVLTDGEFTLTDASLSLKLGGMNAHLSSELENEKCEGRDWKRSKPPLAVSNHPTCQVDGCIADLRLAKDYHRRHKVCEMHAKSASVSLGGVIQRFCQQCSRFHMLQEFDEEKRSCRRRLAGHNRRRRKMNIQSANGANSLNEENISRYILISILRILSELHANKSDQKNDEGILFQLLRMLTGSLNGASHVELCRLVQSLQSPQSAETSNAVSSQGSPGFLPSSIPGSSRILASLNSVPSTIDTQDPAIINGSQSGNFAIKAAQGSQKVHNEIAKENPGCLPVILDKQKEPDGSAKVEHNNTTWGRTHVKLNDFDLNDIYIESQDEREESDKLSPTTSSERFDAIQFGSSAGHLFSAQNNDQISPQMSANSESASDKSPSSSSGEVQCCTERIIFKLFGKDPSDLPHVLRSQILSWLSRSPTDIESYIRPGCIVLTIYVRLPRKTWQELTRNLIPKLKRLLEDSHDIFWTTGWICAKVGHQLAFIYNGRVLLDRSFLLSNEDTPMILSVTPIAVSFSEGATFTVKATNLTSGTKKLCCAYQGKQLIHESSASYNEGDLSGDTFDCHEEIQYFRFTCSFPKTDGRGFIEIEDQELSTGFLPFIVAEDDICSELCTLESLMNGCDIDSGKLKERGEVLEFLHVFGWLLERFRLAYDLDFPNHQDSRLSNLEIKWLLEFSVEHDWCAVLKKLLNILFDTKIGLAYYYMEQLLDEVSLLHRAVRRNCGPMVEFLLNYVPQQNAVPQANISQLLTSPLFRVDKRGSSGVTALHVAAETAGAERVLNILTSGPEECWLHTWESDRDDDGLTPEGLALQKGHDHYVQLIEQKKKQRPTIGHVAIHMPNDVLQPFERASESVVNEWEQKPHGLQIDMRKTVVNEQKSHELQIDMSRTGQLQCKLCDRQSFYRSGQYRMLNYRPAILSMVAIAAVCVCVGILFKSPPEVTFILPPFRWESLGYGSI